MEKLFNSFVAFMPKLVFVLSLAGMFGQFSKGSIIGTLFFAFIATFTFIAIKLDKDDNK